MRLSTATRACESCSIAAREHARDMVLRAYIHWIRGHVILLKHRYVTYARGEMRYLTNPLTNALRAWYASLSREDHVPHQP